MLNSMKHNKLDYLYNFVVILTSLLSFQMVFTLIIVVMVVYLCGFFIAYLAESAWIKSAVLNLVSREHKK